MIIPRFRLIGLVAIQVCLTVMVAESALPSVEQIQQYRDLAAKGLDVAQHNLGVCYYYGQGVGQNDSEAVSWFRKAAAQGYAASQYNLGLCYENGEGVKQSFADAVKWYRKSADQGNAKAQYNLGVCYYKGLGVAQSNSEAANWYLPWLPINETKFDINRVTLSRFETRV